MVGHTDCSVREELENRELVVLEEEELVGSTLCEETMVTIGVDRDLDEEEEGKELEVLQSVLTEDEDEEEEEVVRGAELPVPEVPRGTPSGI